MSNQDLYAGIAMFDKGLQEFAVGQVLSGAREQVNQINAQFVKEDEKRAAMQQFSNDLALQLGAASGGNAALVESVAGRFGLSMPQQVAQETQAKEFDATLKLQEQKLANSEKMMQYQMAMQEQKQQGKERQQLQVQQRLYQARFNQDAKKSLEAYDKASTALKLLNAGTSVADSTVRNYFARASGEVGALTEADKEPFGGSIAFARKIKRWESMARTGKLPESDRDELRMLAEILAKKASEDIDSTASLVSNQMGMNLGLDQEQAMELIYPTAGRRGAKKNATTGVQGSSLLNDPGVSILGE